MNHMPSLSITENEGAVCSLGKGGGVSSAPPGTW